MQDCKPSKTPVMSGSKLSLHSGSTLSDPHEYRQVVGALQYLTITCPDLSYAVNQVCQFMHAPTTEHLQAVKRILRYLKNSVGAGIILKPAPLSLVVAFSNVDWAGCPNSRRSTSGFCTYLGSNLLSWGSKSNPLFQDLARKLNTKLLRSPFQKCYGFPISYMIFMY